MQRLLFLIVLLFLLWGCAPNLYVMPVGGEAPNWLVLLTSYWPDVRYRCAGAAISPHYILTAAHCTRGDHRTRRVVTQYGGEFNRLKVAYTWAEADLAVLQTAKPMRVGYYATVAYADHSQPALVYGACPQYLLTTPRVMYFLNYRTSEPWGATRDYWTEEWLTEYVPKKICGGDSGGALVQGGNLIGINHASDINLISAKGNNILVIPAPQILAKLRDAGILPASAPAKYVNAR